MTVAEMIARLQTLPPYADVLIQDGDEDGCGFIDFAIEQGDDDPAERMGLVILLPQVQS